MSPELKSHARGLELPVLEFDGIVEIWVENLTRWKAVLSDAEFLKVMKGMPLY